jgi:hypothetical protein
VLNDQPRNGLDLCTLGHHQATQSVHGSGFMVVVWSVGVLRI